MQAQIETYKKARQEFIALIRKFPTNKRLDPLFGDWTLKEILAHLVGWSEHQLRVMAIFKKGGIAEHIDNTFIYNAEQVATRRDWDFERTLQYYLDTTERLIKAYESISDTMIGMQIWPDRNYTPISRRSIRTVCCFIEWGISMSYFMMMRILVRRF